MIQRLDKNAKCQSMSNTLDQSGLNEIISNYDKYLQLPSDSSLKDTYRQNLLSRVAAYKSKWGNQAAGLGSLTSSNAQPRENSIVENNEKTRRMLMGDLAIKSIKEFRDALLENGISEGDDGMMKGNQWG